MTEQEMQEAREDDAAVGHINPFGRDSTVHRRKLLFHVDFLESAMADLLSDQDTLVQQGVSMERRRVEQEIVLLWEWFKAYDPKTRHDRYFKPALSAIGREEVDELLPPLQLRAENARLRSALQKIADEGLRPGGELWSAQNETRSHEAVIAMEALDGIT